MQVAYVRNARARRYVLRVRGDGSLRVTIPRGGTQSEAEQVVRRHAAWVREQAAQAAAPPVTDEWPEPTPDRVAHARRELPPRVLELAAVHGLAVRRVQVRRQRSRWGSCSRSGTISLHWRLAFAPEHVRDYVILHELMHLREMNHSPRFWAHVDAAMPERRSAESWLKAHARWL